MAAWMAVTAHSTFAGADFAGGSSRGDGAEVVKKESCTVRLLAANRRHWQVKESVQAATKSVPSEELRTGGI